MRIIVLISTLAIATAAAAQDAGSKRPANKAGPRVEQPAANPAPSSPEPDYAKQRAADEARERAWDEKMKRTMRSICSGATGC